MLTQAKHPVPAMRESRLRRALGALPQAAAARPQPYYGGGLGELLDGGILTTREGEIFARECDLREHGWNSRAMARRAVAKLPALAGLEPQRARKACAATWQSAVWLDIETAGWMGRPMFLAGMLRCEKGNLIVKQLFARHYAEERALVAELCRELKSAAVLFTFNGKSFDMPFVRDRAEYHRMTPPSCPEHVDILHLARRRWRGVLPDCRLQTLERHVCARHRRGDVPSSEIPARYHEYVHSGDPALVAPVFRHNVLDLVTLLEISATLADRGGKK